MTTKPEFPAPAIEVDGLSYWYPDGTLALSEVSFRVEPGERVALIGANGAGKSTLLLHLNGLLDPAGRVRICGKAVEKSTMREVRRLAGLMFQNPEDQLFCASIEEDLMFGPRCHGMEEAEAVRRSRESLEAVGLPLSIAGKSAYHLSIGQKKRAALASVLVLRPEVLLLDEPTSSLDPKGRRELLELLHQVGGTQLVVTHDLEWAGKLCTRFIVMSGGRIAAQGAASEILSDASLLERNGLL